MSPRPCVSVVLPTLNRSRLLRRAVASVLNQSFRDFELLVVDDGSSEDISAVVDAFEDARARVIRHDVRQGPGAARNTGIAAARGEFIAFQDSDDEWRLHKLERQVQIMRTHPHIALCLSGMLRLNQDKQVWVYPPPANRRLLDSDAVQGIRMGGMAFTQTWLVRREVLPNNAFDARMKIWDDWNLLLGIVHEHPVYFEPELLTVSYVSGDSVSLRLADRVTDLALIISNHSDSAGSQLRSRLHYMKARYGLMLGHRRDAAQETLQSLKHSPANIKAWIMLGMLLLGQGFAKRVFGRGAAT